MKTAKELIAKLLNMLGIDNEQEFCNKYDVVYGTLQSWKFRNSIPYELILDICKKNNIRLESVFYDEIAPVRDVISVRYYQDISASAGYGVINCDEQCSEIVLDKSFAKELLNVNNAKNIDIIKIYGDSMEPFVHSGEFVVVERNKNDFNSIKDGEIVIININGDIYCKKILKNPYTKEITLSSLNSFYPDFKINEEDFENTKIIGVVSKAISIKDFERAFIKINN
ncbi:LexA family transcriptional regulator [Campylobacter sp. RM12640]|uniref:LexA family transcriptional regulator n=1 Tax=unclassified Campylobacter TaxID=2593542 RepID=UPI0030147A04|nr:LexA family transcriptional regulator [Campylobacter sp. RM12640]MBZ7989950.1 LexA family transcriptional regulator [Campylobacter sp. RM12635]